MYLLLLTASVLAASVLGKSLNDFDTYNAEECQRVRRPWHKLTSDERMLYVDGILELRKNGAGSLTEDEFANIASVHDDPYAGFTHHTSSYLFWHGYVMWELESRIRNLGGKFKCFAMPYWDFTLEVGREDNPLLFEGGEIGGSGDPNNFNAVNEYSWPPSVDEFWVPHNCYAEGDHFPQCSLKRGLREKFAMPTASAIGNTLINNADFRDIASYCYISGRAFNLVDQIPSYMEKFPQGYEPIWWLFHSFAQYHQALWTDCHGYDVLDVDELEQHPSAFTAYCESEECYDAQIYPAEWREFGIDDPMHFPPVLQSAEWSYVHNNDLTIRQLYMLPKWNIVYELDTDPDDFYVRSGLANFCKDKLSQDWFQWEEESGTDDVKEMSDVSFKLLGVRHELWPRVVGIVMLLSMIAYAVSYQCKKKMKVSDGVGSYGTYA